MGAAGAACISITDPVACCQHLKLGTDMRGNPLGTPVAGGIHSCCVIKVVVHVTIIKIRTIRVVAFNVGKVIKYPAVCQAMLPDLLIGGMDKAIFALAFGMPGHENEGYRMRRRPWLGSSWPVLRNQYLHIGQVARDVMAIDAAPGPDDDIDMIIVGVV